MILESIFRGNFTLLNVMIHHIYTAQLMECEAYFAFGLSAGMLIRKEAAGKIRGATHE